MNKEGLELQITKLHHQVGNTRNTLSQLEEKYSQFGKGAQIPADAMERVLDVRSNLRENLGNLRTTLPAVLDRKIEGLTDELSVAHAQDHLRLIEKRRGQLRRIQTRVSEDELASDFVASLSEQIDILNSRGISDIEIRKGLEILAGREKVEQEGVEAFQQKEEVIVPQRRTPPVGEIFLVEDYVDEDEKGSERFLPKQVVIKKQTGEILVDGEELALGPAATAFFRAMAEIGRVEEGVVLDLVTRRMKEINGQIRTKASTAYGNLLTSARKRGSKFEEMINLLIQHQGYDEYYYTKLRFNPEVDVRFVVGSEPEELNAQSGLEQELLTKFTLELKGFEVGMGALVRQDQIAHIREAANSLGMEITEEEVGNQVLFQVISTQIVKKKTTLN